MSAVPVAVLLCALVAPPEEGANGLVRSDAALRDIEKLSKHIASFFEGLDEDDRQEQQKAIESLEKEVDKIERKERLDDDDSLLAYLGDWELAFELAKPEDRALTSKAGRGFFRHYFMDRYFGEPIMYLARIPDGYGRGDDDELPPAIVALLPDLGLSGEELDEAVAERAEAIYAGIDDHIILIPLGPGVGDPDRPERAETREVEGSWMTDDGLKTMFTAFRVLLEQLRVDRSRIVLDGWGEAGTDAFRVATAFPSWWAGAINRSGGVEGPDIIMTNMGGAPILYVAGGADGELPDLETVRALDDPACPLTVIEDGGSALEPSEDLQAALVEWLGTTRRDLAPDEIDYKLGELRAQNVSWIKVMEINRRAAAQPEDKDFPRVTASIDRASNTITIETVNVFELWVYLSDALVDLGRDVTIRVNGAEHSKRGYRRSLRELLENRYYNSSGDGGLYVAAELVNGLDANVQ